MRGLNKINSRAIPLLRINVDTDAIIPSREMKKVSKRGLSEGLFAGWRYLSNESRVLNPDFILNDPYYREAQILLVEITLAVVQVVSMRYGRFMNMVFALLLRHLLGRYFIRTAFVMGYYL